VATILLKKNPVLTGPKAAATLKRDYQINMSAKTLNDELKKVVCVCEL
jgi:hypothetical protein